MKLYIKGHNPAFFFFLSCQQVYVWDRVIWTAQPIFNSRRLWERLSTNAALRGKVLYSYKIWKRKKNHQFFQWREESRGMFQGSVLRPLLFNIFIRKPGNSWLVEQEKLVGDSTFAGQTAGWLYKEQDRNRMCNKMIEDDRNYRIWKE